MENENKLVDRIQITITNEMTDAECKEITQLVRSLNTPYIFSR